MPNPFVISSDKRTGSHFLQTGLHEHSLVHCRGERYRWPNPSQFEDETRPDWFDAMFRYGAENGVQWSGVVLQRMDCGRGGPYENLRDRIKAVHPDVQVIRLYRKNLFAQFVSWRLACERKGFNYYKGDKPLPECTLMLPRREMFRWLDNVTRRWKDEPKEWEGVGQLVVYYEDLVADYAGTTARVFEFLGLAPEPVEPLTLRANPKPLPEVVVNYTEAVGWLKAHPSWRYLVQNFGL